MYFNKKTHRISYYIKSNWQIWHHTFYARVRNSCQKRPNFLSQWEQLKVLAPYCLQANFRNSCHNKRPNFLSQWEQSKVLTPCFFVFTCAHEDSLWTKNNVYVCVFMSSNFRNSCQKRPNFLSQWEQLKVWLAVFGLTWL